MNFIEYLMDNSPIDLAHDASSFTIVALVVFTMSMKLGLLWLSVYVAASAVKRAVF